VLTDGYLSISDRKKDIIISGGENVASIEVENRLYSHPGVAEVAVIGVPDLKWGETVKAVVVPAGGGTLTERDRPAPACAPRQPGRPRPGLHAGQLLQLPRRPASDHVGAPRHRRR
jgi:fatty-acyl-CoA synthase